MDEGYDACAAQLALDAEFVRGDGWLQVLEGDARGGGQAADR